MCGKVLVIAPFHISAPLICFEVFAIHAEGCACYKLPLHLKLLVSQFVGCAGRLFQSTLVERNRQRCGYASTADVASGSLGLTDSCILSCLAAGKKLVRCIALHHNTSFPLLQLFCFCSSFSNTDTTS
jgi:hypothetical protein